MTGIDLIAAERRRQIEVEGFDAVHDSQYNDCELEQAAIAYLGAAVACQTGEDCLSTYPSGSPPPFWPLPDHWWKPCEDPVRNLVKAGALVCAAIDLILARRNQNTAAGQQRGE